MRKNITAACMLCAVLAAAAAAQEWEEGSLFGDEESNSAVVQKADPADERVSSAQNAVLEGIQLSSEPGDEEHEKIITGYFIFRDKPTSYFFEAKPRENKIVFDFNDTEMGSSPIPSQKEPPIEGFRIEETKIDINAEVQGLTPEWHDVLRVSFFMDNIPEITVKDEYSIISFSFRWTTDPTQIKKYVQERNTGKVFLFSSLGLGAVGGGLLAYFLIQPDTPPEEPKPLGIDDLPSHPDN